MKSLFCSAFIFIALIRLTHGASLTTDIAYGRAGGEILRLDACVPEGNGPFPAVILVHGGGWTAGDKSGGPQKGYMAPMHETLTQAGFAWFSINYRLIPAFTYDAAVDDVQAAIRWVKAHAADYHLDPQRITLAGESAGGNLVEMAVVRGDDSTRVAAVVAFYGPADLVTEAIRHKGELTPGMMAISQRKTFDEETRTRLQAASPVYFVKSGLPPFLLVHGTADQSVDYEQSSLMQAKLRAAGGQCDLLPIEKGVHGMISWDSVAPHYKQDVVAWLRRTLNVPASPAH